MRTSGGPVGSFRRRLSGVSWPRIAYRYGFGPAAPAVLQGVFAAASELAARRPHTSELRRLDLLAPEGLVEPAVLGRAQEVERLMDRMHAAGISGIHGSFRALTRAAGGSVHLGNLSRLRKHRRDSVSFAAARDLDRCEYNRHFDATLLTETSARAALEDPDVTVQAGGEARRRSGDAFVGRVVAPLMAGRRVLMLGSLSGALPVKVLRARASEVVVIEDTTAGAACARLNARIAAWRDIRPYNFQVITGEVRLFLSGALGRFDVVTVFRSPGSSSEQDLARVIHCAALMDAVLVLQASEAGGNDGPATVFNLHHLMREAGYQEVGVHAPPGADAPLLVGQACIGTRSRSARSARASYP